MQTLNFSSGCHFIRSSQMVGAGLGTDVVTDVTGDEDGELVGSLVDSLVGLKVGRPDLGPVGSSV